MLRANSPIHLGQRLVAPFSLFDRVVELAALFIRLLIDLVTRHQEANVRIHRLLTIANKLYVLTGQTMLRISVIFAQSELLGGLVTI